MHLTQLYLLRADSCLVSDLVSISPFRFKNSEKIEQPQVEAAPKTIAAARIRARPRGKCACETLEMEMTRYINLQRGTPHVR
jgi:hypothetical protein